MLPRNNETKFILLFGLLVVGGLLMVGQSLNKSWSSNYKNTSSDSIRQTTLSSELKQGYNQNPGSSSVNDNQSLVLSSGPAILVTNSGIKSEVLENSPVISNLKKIQKLVLPSDRTIQLVGVVSENALDVAAKITSLAHVSDMPIYLILSGPGGSVLTGSILISAIQASAAPVYTICDVMCASMDAMIHQYGKKRYITDRTIMMFHPAAAGTDGDVDRMYSMTKFLKRFTTKMEMEVSKRQGITFEQYKEKTQVNLWIDAEDSLKEGISDGTVNYGFTFNSADLNLSHASDKTKNKQLPKTTPAHTNPYDFNWICKECMNGQFQW